MQKYLIRDDRRHSCRNNLSCEPRGDVRISSRTEREWRTAWKLCANFGYIVFEGVHASNRIDVVKFSSLDFFDRILAYSCRRDVERLSEEKKTDV